MFSFKLSAQMLQLAFHFNALGSMKTYLGKCANYIFVNSHMLLCLMKLQVSLRHVGKYPEEIHFQVA